MLWGCSGGVTQSLIWGKGRVNPRGSNKRGGRENASNIPGVFKYASFTLPRSKEIFIDTPPCDHNTASILTLFFFFFFSFHTVTMPLRHANPLKNPDHYATPLGPSAGAPASYASAQRDLAGYDYGN